MELYKARKNLQWLDHFADLTHRPVDGIERQWILICVQRLDRQTSD